MKDFTLALLNKLLYQAREKHNINHCLTQSKLKDYVTVESTEIDMINDNKYNINVLDIRVLNNLCNKGFSLSHIQVMTLPKNDNVSELRVMVYFNENNIHTQTKEFVDMTFDLDNSTKKR